jgi:RNA polymerase sigma factor (sigma-70 family)
MSGPGADDPAPLAPAPAAVDGFEATWQRWRLPMLQLATLLIDARDVAEDVVQDAFLGLHRRWVDVDNPVAYLRTAVVNGCRSVLRRRLLARALPPVSAIPHPDAASAVLVSEEHREVMAALRRLPRRQQEVLVLKYWQDLSDEQIALTLRLSASTVRATATRARTALAAILDGPQ